MKLKELNINGEIKESVWVHPDTKKLLEKYKGNLSFGKFVNQLVQNYAIAKSKE